jgi:hypothetical protein
MYETDLREWEEYDSRLTDDGPFMRPASPPRRGYPRSTQNYEGPFLADRENERGPLTQAPKEECGCARRKSLGAAGSADRENTETYSGETVALTGSEADVIAAEGETSGCGAGCPEPSAQYRKTIKSKGNPQGSVIERTQGDPKVNLALQLFDYDVNEYRLVKTNHRNAVAKITEFVVNRLAQTDQPIAVTITGSASRTGAASFNDVLSCKRAECVADNLRLGADRFRGFATRVQVNSAGEGFIKATCKGRDCELGEFRSVLVQVHSPNDPQPPIPPVPGCNAYSIRCCSFHTRLLQEALLGDLLKKSLPGVPDSLKSKLIGLIKKGISQLARKLAPKLSAALSELLLLFPADLLEENGVFEVTERCQPNPRTSVLCYTGFGLRLRVPVNLDDLLDQGLGSLPAPAKKALKEVLKKALPKAILDRAQPIESDSPGPVVEFDLVQPKDIRVFSGRVLVGKDIFFPGRVDVEFASDPWKVPDPLRRPRITNCRNAICNQGGIKLVVGEGKGIELFAVSIGDFAQGSCVCRTSSASRELETEMPSEAYGEMQSEAVGEAESEAAGETEGETVSELEGETQSETSETESETETETEAWTTELESLEVDPYAPIRSAMSSEYANLSAEEVTLTLGGMPARVVLHQLLNSPAAKQVALAGLLGSGARQTVRVEGSDISIPGYLRIMSRLCREVAQEYEGARTS